MVAGVADGGRGQDEGGGGAIPGTDPAQPAQQGGEVRAEHAAVDVALVDDDVAQPPQEGRPALVQRQQGVVHEVGVGEHELGVVADPTAFLGGGVTVVRRRPDAGHRHGLHPCQLVGSQGLGGGQVEGGGPPTGRRSGALHERRQDRQQVAQALARGRPRGHDDVRPGVCEVGGLALVRPQRGDAGTGARGVHGRVHPVGPGDRCGRTRGHLVDVPQPVRAGAGRQGRERRRGVEADGRRRCGASSCGHCRYRNPEGGRPSRPLG